MFKNKGFTLIELIVVITIVITLLGLSIPAVLNYQKTQAENEEIKNFISSYRSTQNLALTTDTTYTINFTNGQVKICPFNSTNCKIFNNSFLRSSDTKINIDRYGNLVDDAGNFLTKNEITLFSIFSANKKIYINKVGRIDYVEAAQ